MDLVDTDWRDDVPTGCSDPLCVIFESHTKHKHKRGCNCSSCRGRRNRRSGKRAQNVAYRNAGGVEAFRNAVSNEETWSAFSWCPGMRWEVKSGASIPKWVTSAISQVLSAGHGDDIRPALIIKPKGTSTHWVLMKLKDLEAECRELVQTVVASPASINESVNESITDERMSAVQNRLHTIRAEVDAAEKCLRGWDK